MLFDKKAVFSLALASGLASFPAALGAAIQDTSGNPYGSGHVDYVFDLANADIQPVSTFPLIPCQFILTLASRMDTLALLFLSMGEPLHHNLTFFAQSHLLQLYFSQFHGPTILATKGDRLNVCCIAQPLV